MNQNAYIRPSLDGETILSTKEHGLYKKLIGELLYLSIYTRPYISYAVCALARSPHALTMRHQAMIWRVLRYISATRTLSLNYWKEENNIHMAAYSDSDWTGCLDTWYSATGYIVTIKKSSTGWKRIRQIVVALSSAEAEYISLSTTSKELS